MSEIATGILAVKDGAVTRHVGTYGEYLGRLSGDLGIGAAGAASR